MSAGEALNRAWSLLRPGRLAEALGEPTDRPPSIDRAHWRMRASFGADEWLTIQAGEDPESVARDLRDALRDVVLPALEARSRDDALRDEWLLGVSPGLTQFQRLLYVVILVHALGPRQRLDECVAALRAHVAGTPRQALVELDIKRLGISAR